MISSIEFLTLGRITGVFGIKGWLKVKSFTEPQTNLFAHSEWCLKAQGGAKTVTVLNHKVHGEGWIVQLRGVDDRNTAEGYTKADIIIKADQLPELSSGDFYWHQLIGLRVESHFEGRVVDLGRVDDLLETGANDVLVVVGDAGSIDDRRRLVPYIPSLYVLDVDLKGQCMQVHWDPDF